MQINEKDLHCVAWHLNYLYSMALIKKTADLAKPCETCKYNKDCDFDHAKYFKFLEDRTGVKINYAKSTEKIQGLFEKWGMSNLEQRVEALEKENVYLSKELDKHLKYQYTLNILTVIAILFISLTGLLKILR